MKEQLRKAYLQVLDFNSTAGTIPRPILDKDRTLRIKLLMEEIEEYRVAVMQKDAVEVVDAAVDILYVALGVFIMHGIEPDEDSFEFNRVGGSVYVSDITQGMKYADVLERLVVMYEMLPDDEKGDALNAILSVLNDMLRHHTIFKFWDYFNQIHENNMSKFCITNEEVADTMVLHKAHNPTYVLMDGLGVVKREDGKILKSINFKPVKLTL